MANQSSNIQKINIDAEGSDSVKRKIWRQIKGHIQRTRFNGKSKNNSLLILQKNRT